ncbi:MAG: type 4a pilus biogenesis protein PilO [Sporomusaceae bacterium]|nr:type 4a pilus biogenesis protein PilO [Sporomusaceae bacterium]
MGNFSWDKLQTTHKIGIFAIGAVLISYLLYELVLSPQFTKIDDLTAKLKSEQQQVKVIEAFVLAHPNPEQHLAELDNKLMQVDNKFPDNPNMSNFLSQVEQLSRDCGVRLNYLKPIKIVNKDKEGYREYDVEFAISGTYSQNMNFLNKTENGLRFINISRIAMKLDNKGLDSKILAKIYSFGVPAVADTANTNAPKDQ